MYCNFYQRLKTAPPILFKTHGQSLILSRFLQDTKSISLLHGAFSIPNFVGLAACGQFLAVVFVGSVGGDERGGLVGTRGANSPRQPSSLARHSFFSRKTCVFSGFAARFNRTHVFYAFGNQPHASLTRRVSNLFLRP